MAPGFTQGLGPRETRMFMVKIKIRQLDKQEATKYITPLTR